MSHVHSTTRGAGWFLYNSTELVIISIFVCIYRTELCLEGTTNSLPKVITHTTLKNANKTICFHYQMRTKCLWPAAAAACEFCVENLLLGVNSIVHNLNSYSFRFRPDRVPRRTNIGMGLGLKIYIYPGSEDRTVIQIK